MILLFYSFDEAERLEMELRYHPLVGRCRRTGRKTDVTRSVFVHPALQQQGKSCVPKLECAFTYSVRIARTAVDRFDRKRLSARVTTSVNITLFLCMQEDTYDG